MQLLQILDGVNGQIIYMKNKFYITVCNYRLIVNNNYNSYLKHINHNKEATVSGSFFIIELLLQEYNHHEF